MGEQTLLDSVLWHVRSWDEIKRTSLFTLANYANVFLLVGFVIFAIIQTRSKIVRDLSLRLHPAAAVMIHLLPVITSFCPNMPFVLRKRPTRRRILVGWKRLASRQ
jgi:hypothetical protein